MRTKNIIAERWVFVEALAEELLRRERMIGKEITDFLERIADAGKSPEQEGGDSGSD